MRVKTDAGHKKDYVELLSEGFERIAAWSVEHRWILFFVSLIVFGVGGYYASKARVDMSFEAFFDREDPTYSAYRQYRSDFGSDEVSYILYRAPDKAHGPWNIDIMRKISRLTKELEETVPFAREVTSLTNVEYMEGVPGGIEIHELLDEMPESQEALLKIRDKVLAKPMYVGGLVSKNAEYAAIIIQMEKSSIDPPEEITLPEKNADETDAFLEDGKDALMEKKKAGGALEQLYPQATEAAINKLLNNPEYKEIEFFHAGDVPFNSAYNRLVATDIAVLMGISYLVVTVLLILIFRSPVGVIGPVVVVFVSICVTIGFLGIMGWNIDYMFSLIPTLLIAVGVADSIHIITEFNNHFKALGGRKEAIRKTLRHLGPPCLLTSLTTAVGFLSMSVSPVKSVAHLAYYSSAGVVAAFLGSVSLLVVFLSLGPETLREKPGKQEKKNSGDDPLITQFLTAIAKIDIRHRKLILLISGAALVVSSFGVTRLTVDTNFLEDFKDYVPIKKTMAFVDDVMSGTNSVVYLFDTEKPDGVKDPAVLREIERMQQEAEKYPDFVKKTYSIVDVIKDFNMSFHGGDPSYYTIPESKALVSQYLLLYEMSGGSELDDYVSGDFLRAALELRCKWVETSRSNQLLDDLNAYLAANPLKFSKAEPTGIGALWVKFTDYITTSQIRGILLAYSVITLIMCFIFKSVRVGLFSMIPNVIPVVIVLGSMGWYGLPLDYTRLLIATVAIGIAVDDTIHLLTRYHLEFKKCRNYEKALTKSMTDVGKALFLTTVMLVAGFLVYLASSLFAQAMFGVLLAGTLSLALAADFLLLPALILTFKPFGKEERRQENGR